MRRRRRWRVPGGGGRAAAPRFPPPPTEDTAAVSRRATQLASTTPPTARLVPCRSPRLPWPWRVPGRQHYPLSHPLSLYLPLPPLRVPCPLVPSSLFPFAFVTFPPTPGRATPLPCPLFPAPHSFPPSLSAGAGGRYGGRHRDGSTATRRWRGCWWGRARPPRREWLADRQGHPVCGGGRPGPAGGRGRGGGVDRARSPCKCIDEGAGFGGGV